MTVTCFVDTNVLVYARDATDPEKLNRAKDWLTLLWELRAGRLSYQVLQEYYITVTRKLSPGMPELEAQDDVRAFFAWEPVVTNSEILEGAWSVQQRYGLNWWDALIVSAARAAQCQYLLTDRWRQSKSVLDCCLYEVA